MTTQRAQHTDRTFEQDLAELRERLRGMGGLVERAIADAIRSVLERDEAIAGAIIQNDRLINRCEVEIDDLCRRILALRQPAASDLRFVTTALKIVTDLERMGDLAVNIASRALDLAQVPPLPLPDLNRLSEVAQSQLHGSLDAFLMADASKAEAIVKGDELLDALFHNLFNELLARMMEDSRSIRRGTALLFIIKHLERLGDHAVNVAEMVFYLVEGTDVRHPHSREAPV